MRAMNRKTGGRFEKFAFNIFMTLYFAFAVHVQAWTEDVSKEETVKAIVSQCRVGTDDEYAKIMKALKHHPASVAPPELRAIITRLSPFRMDLQSGLAWRRNRITLYWFVGEFGAKKPASEVAALFSDTLEELGFAIARSDFEDRTKKEYVKTAGDFSHIFRIEGLERFIGTAAQSAGGSFVYEIEYLVDTGKPFLRDVLIEYPALSCPEMIPEVLTFFSDQKVTNVSYGGTWTRFYDFDIDASYADEKSAKGAFGKLVALVESLGFDLERDDGGILTYIKKGASGPVLYLALKKGGIVNFRIQPYTTM
jgi:hypothetical protein